MNTEEVKNETASHSPVIVNDSDSAGTLALNPEENRSLFTLLDKRQQQLVIVLTYLSCIVLGCTLAVLAFQYEYLAQIQHQPFEMRDWMIGLIFMLLSLPAVGVLNRKK